MFTYLPSLSLILPDSSSVFSSWDKYIFPTDGVTLKNLANPAFSIITDKKIADVVSAIRSNLEDSGRTPGEVATTSKDGHIMYDFAVSDVPGCRIVVYSTDSVSPGSLSDLTVLILGDVDLDVMKACEPREDEDTVEGRLVQAPEAAHSYLRASAFPPLPTLGREYLSSYLKNVSPFDVGMYDRVSVGKSVCYTGSESFKNGWKRTSTNVDGVKGFKGKTVTGKRGMVKVRFEAIFNEDRCEPSRIPTGGSASNLYNYPPAEGSELHLVDAELVGDKYYDSFSPVEGGGIGVLTSSHEGFLDAIGLGVINKAKMDKKGIKTLEELEGKVVYAGGGIGVVEKTGYPDFVDIEDVEDKGEGEEEEFDMEEVERAEREAREAMERLEKLKMKAEKAMMRRKAAKDKTNS
ncbi:hypothetical protein TrCOL_g11777 [Triparma columacea]|uniref:Uncharacterized protein n=1 Tax=Triparma columacea TaxID=722753 RepID=A0A9W7L2M9_9STRA|nr:hypothetical protein TrCOL_g11777 [Triparma columacea]